VTANVRSAASVNTQRCLKVPSSMGSMSTFVLRALWMLSVNFTHTVVVGE
jgi:hypothetical protein